MMYLLGVRLFRSFWSGRLESDRVKVEGRRNEGWKLSVATKASIKNRKKYNTDTIN